MTKAEDLGDGLRRLVAPNPSPMTERGTNTYLLGKSRVTVIDPGPDLAAHLDAILSAVGRGRVERILVTHAHLDHSALAPRLAARTGAEILAFGDAAAGRSPRMRPLTGLGGGEGIDREFVPDTALDDGATVRTEAGSLQALWTPGHFGNHLSFLWGQTAFSGDLVMGWSSSIVSPPDGDVAQFIASCRRLLGAGPSILHPGHGAPVTAPGERIKWLVAHRLQRENEVLTALAKGPATADALARRIYVDLAPDLLPAAARNVLAHLVDLADRGQVVPRGGVRANAAFALV